MASPAEQRVYRAKERLHRARERAAQTGYRPDSKQAVAAAERELDAAFAAGERSQLQGAEHVGRLLAHDREVRGREVAARRKAAADTRDRNEAVHAEQPEPTAARLARTLGYDPAAERPYGEPW